MYQLLLSLFFILSTHVVVLSFNISQESNSDQVVFMQCDLGSLKSVRSFAENFLKTESRLDLLINNAGGTVFFERAQDWDTSSVSLH